MKLRNLWICTSEYNSSDHLILYDLDIRIICEFVIAVERGCFRFQICLLLDDIGGDQSIDGFLGRLFFDYPDRAFCS